MKKNIILFLFLAFISAKELSRDILVLTNGNTLNGEIVSRNYKEIKFYSSELDLTRTFLMNDIKDLTQDGIYIIKNGVLVAPEREPSLSLSKYGNILIGLGGLFIASTFTNPSDELTLDEIESKADFTRLRGRTGGLLIAIGGFLQIVDE
tara:strand:+ start:64 stop:513 length:450 start_codon:yes stop_codon:yes gene_type:complete